MRLHSSTSADALNASCHCMTLDRLALVAGRDMSTGDLRGLIEGRTSLFSDSPVFVPEDDLNRMLELVEVVERLARCPDFVRLVLANAPLIAHEPSATRGALMGYDFHLGDGGPQLIEVNTNAGGAYLNALAIDAQRACCPEVDWRVTRYDGADLMNVATAMFAEEWHRERGELRLRRIAIVDDDPEGQYLYPEFLIVRERLKRSGIDAVIADPSDLTFEGGVLFADGLPVDLVYNRLTDFYLDQPTHATLRAAFLNRAVLVTPSPRHHAIYANKRNLVLLSDAQAMASIGVEPADIDVLLRSIPKTVFVTSETAGELWTSRSELFFKPVAGHASKAVYRGDKLTRKVWNETILPGAYIAQKRVPPSTRSVIVNGEPKALKMDVRLYTYAGGLLLAAARLYDGQTTNFRTPGGGFAPVCVV